MKEILIILLCFIASFSRAQQIDTLRIESDAFNATRTVYVHTPMFYKYKSEEVKLPVFYILDGQHEWFINPFLNTVEYLQYTHEIPQAIIVVIPHENRNKECRVGTIENDSVPLLEFISSELPLEIEKYDPNGFNLLVGHSATASFALYAYLNKPDFYSAVLSNTPMYLLEEAMGYIQDHQEINRSNIFLSVGGEKDKYHRENYEKVRSIYPSIFSEITTFEADFSTHNAVPIVANPTFLSRLFVNFLGRFSHIAEVDRNFKIKEPPKSVEDEILKINTVIAKEEYNFSMELPEINGLASKYLNSDLNDYGIAIYSVGVELYPDFYQFHLSLGELLLDEQKKGSSEHLIKAMELIEKYESDLEWKDKILEEIKNLYQTATNTEYRP